jgi:hypothetical protein
MEHKERARNQTAKGSRMVPVQFVPKIEHAEHAEDTQRNNLLDHFELVWRKRLRPQTIRGHL